MPLTTDERAAVRRKHAVASLHRSLEAADRADRSFWRALAPEERVLEVWRLSEELWSIAKGEADEPGLCRSHTRLLRR